MELIAGARIPIVSYSRLVVRGSDPAEKLNRHLGSRNILDLRCSSRACLARRLRRDSHLDSGAIKRGFHESVRGGSLSQDLPDELVIHSKRETLRPIGSIVQNVTESNVNENT